MENPEAFPVTQLNAKHHFLQEVQESKESKFVYESMKQPQTSSTAAAEREKSALDEVLEVESKKEY